MKKESFTKILEVIAVGILLLGIVQIILFISPQITIMNNAAAQGVTSKEILDYLWQQIIPQVLTYIMFTIGFSFSILAMRKILLKLDYYTLEKTASNFQQVNFIENSKDDCFLEDFEVVENHNNN